MAVPKFQDFLYPFLRLLKDGDMTKADITSALISHFSLTEEDCAIRTRSGSLTQLSDRIGWCVQWLRRAEFIEIVTRATYRITSVGLKYLSTHSKLHQSDLMKYPAFAAYASSKNTSTHTTSLAVPTDNPHISELTPTEQLEQAHETISNDLAADLLSKVMEQTPTFFEHLVVDLLVKMGYGGAYSDAAQVTQLTNDEGIDGINIAVDESAQGVTSAAQSTGALVEALITIKTEADANREISEDLQGEVRRFKSI